MRTLRTWAALGMVTAAFMLVGCSEDDGGSGMTGAVSVTFENWNFSEMDYWIIISSADGSTPLAARRITENGTFHLGIVVPERFTFSGAWRRGSAFGACYSYMNTAQRNWLLRQTDFSGEGEANVYLTYPEGQYSELSIQGPFGSSGSFYQTSDSSAQATLFSMRPEADNTVSFVGIVRGELVEYGGWVTGLAFTPNSINNYNLALDQPLASYVITATRPLNFIDLSGVRSANFAPYRLGDTTVTGGSQSFSLRVPEFPVDAYWLYGDMRSSSILYQQWRKTVNEIPAVFSVSDASVSSVADGMDSDFRDVVVQGEADVVWGLWDNENGGSQIAWMVSEEPGASTIARPVLPDSIFDLLQANPHELQPVLVGLYDYVPAVGYDDYIELSSDASSPYIYGRCDGLYTHGLTMGVATAEQMRRIMNQWMPEGMDMGWWMLGMPGRAE